MLVSRRAHGAHHRAPFDGNYCIVSGVWNPVLDQVCTQHGYVTLVQELLSPWSLKVFSTATIRRDNLVKFAQGIVWHCMVINIAPLRAPLPVKCVGVYPAQVYNERSMPMLRAAATRASSGTSSDLFSGSLALSHAAGMSRGTNGRRTLRWSASYRAYSERRCTSTRMGAKLVFQ